MTFIKQPRVCQAARRCLPAGQVLVCHTAGQTAVPRLPWQGGQRGAGGEPLGAPARRLPSRVRGPREFARLLPTATSGSGKVSFPAVLTEMQPCLCRPLRRNPVWSLGGKPRHCTPGPPDQAGSPSPPVWIPCSAPCRPPAGPPSTPLQPSTPFCAGHVGDHLQPPQSSRPPVLAPWFSLSGVSAPHLPRYGSGCAPQAVPLQSESPVPAHVALLGDNGLCRHDQVKVRSG